MNSSDTEIRVVWHYDGTYEDNEFGLIPNINDSYYQNPYNNSTYIRNADGGIEEYGRCRLTKYQRIMVKIESVEKGPFHWKLTDEGGDELYSCSDSRKDLEEFFELIPSTVK